MSFNAKQTSSSIATLASAVLKDPASSEVAKELAGSALAQASSVKQTSARMEEIASEILGQSWHSQTVLSLAGSVLAQANKER